MGCGSSAPSPQAPIHIEQALAANAVKHVNNADTNGVDTKGVPDASSGLLRSNSDGAAGSPAWPWSASPEPDAAPGSAAGSPALGSPVPSPFLRTSHDKPAEVVQAEVDEIRHQQRSLQMARLGLPYDDLDDIPATSKLLNHVDRPQASARQPPATSAPNFPYFDASAAAEKEAPRAGAAPRSPAQPGAAAEEGRNFYLTESGDLAFVPSRPAAEAQRQPEAEAEATRLLTEELLLQQEREDSRHREVTPGDDIGPPVSVDGEPDDEAEAGAASTAQAPPPIPSLDLPFGVLQQAHEQTATKPTWFSAADVQAYALSLGMDLIKDKQLMWIAEQALKAPLPEGWEEVLHSDGQAYFLHRSGNTSSWTHPLEAHYVKLYFGLRDQDAPSAGGQGEAAAVLPTGGQSSAMNSIRGRVLLGGLQPGPFPASDGDLGTSMATAVPVPESARPGSERSSIDRPRRSRARQAASQSRPVSSQSSRPYSSHSAQYSAPGPAPPFDPRSMNMNHMMTSSVPAMPSFQPLPPMPMPMPAVGAAWASPAAAMYSGSSVPSQAVPLPPAGQSPKRPHSRSRAKKQQGGGALSPRGLHSSVPLPQAEASALNPLAGEASVEHVLESRLTHLSSTLWMVQSQLGAVQHEFEQFKSASPSPAAQRPHGLPDSPTSPAEGGAAVLSDTDNAAGPRQYDLEPQPFPILA